MKQHSEQGSAIIWILIAVALFAALNFAFNSSSRTSTSLLTDEEATTYANQIIAYGNDVKSAVKRLQLRGCSDTEISFENSIVSGYANPNSPSSQKCHVFDIAGGGLNYNDLNSLDIYFVNGNATEGVGTDCASADCSELMLVLRLNQTVNEKASAEKLCIKINQALGNDDAMTNTIFGDDTPGSLSSNFFVGEYEFSFLNDEAIFEDKKSYCGSVSAEIHSYHHVLIAR